jgi:hypothetical protein
MGHIGNTAQTAFTSFDKQTITGSGTAVYTLSHNVANEQEIEVFVNNVRQEGGSGKAFTVSGNQITFTENIASTDTVYVNFQGKAVQTVSHPSDQPLQATTGNFSGAVSVGTIKEGTGTNTAMTIDSSGRTRIHQNNTATVSAPASGALVLSGIPDWANKITLVTHDLSPDTASGFIRIRFTVGGSPTTAPIYKYTEARWIDTGSADVEDNGSGSNYIETVNFGNVANLQSYILTFYKVDDYIYKFNGTKYNQQYSYYYIAFSGSVETTAAVDGFSIICSTGNFDNGSARAFWE